MFIFFFPPLLFPFSFSSPCIPLPLLLSPPLLHIFLSISPIFTRDRTVVRGVTLKSFSIPFFSYFILIFPFPLIFDKVPFAPLSLYPFYLSLSQFPIEMYFHDYHLVDVYFHN